jgi:murein DD-endopeptidase MepM/ murein hydrolase activator NlpD
VIECLISKNNYTLPISRNLITRIDRTSSPAHIGKLRNAVDFLAPIGTPVVASANGIVTYVEDSFNIGGPDYSYWKFSNFIVLMHPNGEFTRYDHLAFESSRVRINQKVECGQHIGNVGLTGFTFIPHLHFQVFVFTGLNIWMDYETLEVRFVNEC